MKIHSNIEEARAACEKYADGIARLMDECGAGEECEDSCAQMFIVAKYYDASGKVQTYYRYNVWRDKQLNTKLSSSVC